MSLRWKRRRKREEQRRLETQQTPRWSPAGAVRDGDDAWFSLDGLIGSPRAVEGPNGSASREPSVDPRDVGEAPPTVPSSRPPQEAGGVERLAYTRRQAAEALGVSISTIDRRVVPSISTVKLPWGQRLIPVDELERFLRNHLAPARPRRARRPAGRPPTLPSSVVERIRLEYTCGRALAEIARALTADRVPTAHGGQKWWPSTVRAVLVRSIPNATDGGSVPA